MTVNLDLADLYGKDIKGNWTLEITDNWGSDRTGTLNSWSLIVTTEAFGSLARAGDRGRSQRIGWNP